MIATMENFKGNKKKEKEKEKKVIKLIISPSAEGGAQSLLPTN